MPFHALFRSRTPAAILVAALFVCVACSGGRDDGDGGPGAVKIAGAVIRSLLSNTVEARQSEAPEPESERPAPAPPPAPLEPAGPESAETCQVPYDGPVTIIPVRHAGALETAMAERRHVDVVYETDDTVVWEDGRVLTTDLEQVGTHLNVLGWAGNPMDIAGTGQRPGASRQNLGWSSATSSFEGSSSKQRKRRRRG